MTAPGRTGKGGDTAARPVGEELSLEIDFATKLSMEGRIVKEKKRRAEPAILRAVQWTVTGGDTAAGAPAVKHAEVGL